MNDEDGRSRTGTPADGKPARSTAELHGRRVRRLLRLRLLLEGRKAKRFGAGTRGASHKQENGEGR